MASNTTSLVEQAVAVLKEHRRPLVIIANDTGLDGLAAGQGLAQALPPEHPVTLLASAAHTAAGTNLPQQLPTVDQFPPSRDFVVSIKTDQTQLASLSYDVQPDRVDIHLVPKKGTFQVSDISMPTTPFVFDHIVTIGLRHLEDLGPAYQNERDFFFHTPIVNIDHRAENSRFGHVNLVDLTAASLSEVVAELALHLTNDKLQPLAAEALLTGVVSATNGFQSERLTPRTLTTASRLMAAGARRDEVVRRLFQKKTVPLLRLWGRALSRLETADHDRLVWAKLTAADLRDYAVAPEQAAQLADELLTTTPTAEFACLLIEMPPKVMAVVIASPTAPVADIPTELVPQSGRYFVGQLTGELGSIEKDIVGALRTALGK